LLDLHGNLAVISVIFCQNEERRPGLQVTNQLPESAHLDAVVLGMANPEGQQ
jgi:hypothetical protein